MNLFYHGFIRNHNFKPRLNDQGLSQSFKKKDQVQVSFLYKCLKNTKFETLFFNIDLIPGIRNEELRYNELIH